MSASTDIARDMAHILPVGLTEQEVSFVYYTEVIGLPARKAAKMADMPVARMTAPHILQARELTKRELRGAMAITKDDVIHGMHEATMQAKMMGDALTTLIGWEKLAKILGYDQPVKIDINVSASLEVQQKLVKEMTDEELVKMLGADNIIDGEFYETK